MNQWILSLWILLSVFCHKSCFQKHVDHSDSGHSLFKAMILASVRPQSCLVLTSWTKQLGTCSHVQHLPYRWNGHPAEGLPGLHSVSAVERRGPGPGRQSQGDPGSGAGVRRALQQLREAVPPRGRLQGEAQRILLWLHLLCVLRALLLGRWVWLGSPQQDRPHVNKSSSSSFLCSYLKQKYFHSWTFFGGRANCLFYAHGITLLKYLPQFFKNCLLMINLLIVASSSIKCQPLHLLFSTYC